MPRYVTPALIVSILLGMQNSGRADEKELTPLFDGKTLEGWHKPFDWGKVWVEDEVIHLEGDRKFFLVTDKTYRDFVLEVEVKLPVGGNSGIQFRSHYKQNNLWGYQAEVDTSDRKWSGGLYDEARRAWIHPLKDKPEAQAAFKNGEWNYYRIEAVGDHIRIWVNDVLTTDLHDFEDAEGFIALQHHGEENMTYRFRNVALRILDSPE